MLATDWHRTETSKCMMIYSGYLAVESIWTMFHPYLTTVKWSWHARHHLQQSWEIFRCDSISNLHKLGIDMNMIIFHPSEYWWIYLPDNNWASFDISLQYNRFNENHLKFTVGICCAQFAVSSHGADIRATIVSVFTAGCGRRASPAPAPQLGIAGI